MDMFRKYSFFPTRSVCKRLVATTSSASSLTSLWVRVLPGFYSLKFVKLVGSSDCGRCWVRWNAKVRLVIGALLPVIAVGLPTLFSVESDDKVGQRPFQDRRLQLSQRWESYCCWAVEKKMILLHVPSLSASLPASLNCWTSSLIASMWDLTVWPGFAAVVE